MRLLGGSLLLSLAVFVAACDSFPENAAITALNGQLSVVFRPCSSDELVTQLTVLQKTGGGTSDADFTEVWHADVRESAGRDSVWPLGTGDPRYSSVSGDPSLALDQGIFRVYVRTTTHLVQDGFGPGFPPEGVARRLGRSSSIQDFLRRDDVC